MEPERNPVAATGTPNCYSLWFFPKCQLLPLGTHLLISPYISDPFTAPNDLLHQASIRLRPVLFATQSLQICASNSKSKEQSCEGQKMSSTWRAIAADSCSCGSHEGPGDLYVEYYHEMHSNILRTIGSHFQLLQQFQPNWEMIKWSSWSKWGKSCTWVVGVLIEDSSQPNKVTIQVSLWILMELCLVQEDFKINTYQRFCTWFIGRNCQAELSRHRYMFAKHMCYL